MTPSQQCKEAGLKSLDQVSKLTGVSVQTLINWHKSKPDLFDVVVLGCRMRLDINLPTGLMGVGNE